MFSLHTLKNNLCSFEDVAELHFTLMNIVMLIRKKYEEGGYPCYCDSYRSSCCCYPCLRLFFKKKVDHPFPQYANFKVSATKRTPQKECVFLNFWIEIVETLRSSESWRS